MYVCVLIMNFLNLSDRKLGGYRELGQLPIDNIVSKHLIVCLSVQNSLRSQGRVLMRSKKSIAIFAYKHWLYSLDMKIKVARHVPRIAFQHSNIPTFQHSNISTTFPGSQLVFNIWNFFFFGSFQEAKTWPQFQLFFIFPLLVKFRVIMGK